MSKLKILPIEAAMVMGCSPQFVRIGLQQGSLEIGNAVKTSSVWTYNINPNLLAIRQGLSVPELEALIKELKQLRMNKNKKQS